MSDLTQRHCTPYEDGVAPLTHEQAQDLLAQLHTDWSLSADAKEIVREFRFANYYETIAFVNAGAWISHREDHHPNLEVGYNRCRVGYSTHAIGGLSDNDFICAAKMDGL
ncbi:MAG: 4a-hydroxytetrahydrobiopterin dehydratase [Acidihalobacter sp.]|jgi:4a-hydroxytetrahydrobiopterin dehydratase|uniref:4a-hydroxytetrahydrobiopterin dehydratase n=1 Tax=Acidihalobacter sp. TaxID=1872108 RepID=UPI00307DAC98